MRCIGHVVLALGFLYGASGPVYATPFSGETPEQQFSCSYSQVAGSFTANRATYSLSGSCLSSSPNVSIPWTAQGAYDARTANGQVQEKIIISGPSPFRGEFRLAMVCNTRNGAPFDPWLRDDGCGTPQIEATGEVANTSNRQDFVKLILNRAELRRGPVTSSFPYNRQPLLAKRANDLRAEAEILAAEKLRAEQLLQGAKQPSGPYTALIHPAILEPKANQILAPQRPVAIKLAPPQGWRVNAYTVIIQRKDANGTWVNHTSIPINAIVAHSPTGYTGFGGGAPPAFLMLPGRWRLSAQASSPKMSGVSDWVEFSAFASADFTAPKRKTPLPF